MKPVRVLFVNAINPLIESHTRYPAIGIGYLIAMLRQQFGDLVECNFVDRHAAEAIRVWRPHLLAVSSVSQNFNHAKEVAALGREAGVPVIVGGYHVTEMPETITRDMDVAAIGEAEYTICDLMQIYLDHGAFPTSELARVKGIAFWQDGELVLTDAREVVGAHTRVLDELPMPARDLMRVRPHTNMFTSRGCPYTCTFCASTRFWPNIRFFSPEYMIEEVRRLIRDYRVRYITFHDDLFIANVKRLRQFHELVLREGLPRQGFKFSCASSATRITDEMAQLLKEMNFVSVSMGLESGNQEVLTRLKGPAFKVETNREAVEILHRHGIHAHASFIIGETHESCEQMMDTYRFVRDNPLSLVNIYVLTPLPGTPVWSDARSKGLVADDMDWNRLSASFEIEWRNVVIVSERCSREQIHTMYLKLRRLRLAKMGRAIASHPFQSDLAAYGKAKLREWAYRLGLAQPA